jgi:hypothetical protein
VRTIVGREGVLRGFTVINSVASSAASLPPMRRPNHASRFEGIAKTNLQASRASDTETLQSQVNKAAKKRLSLSGLEIPHGRLTNMREGLCLQLLCDIEDFFTCSEQDVKASTFLIG